MTVSTKRLMIFIVIFFIFLFIERGLFAQEISLNLWVRLDPAKTKEKPTGFYWVKNIEDAAEELNQRFQEQNSSIRVKVRSRVFDTWDEFNQELNRSISKPQGPDIFLNDSVIATPYSKLKLIQPLSRLGDFNQSPLKEVYPNLLAPVKIAGEIYGVPNATNSRQFFFWIPYLKKLGYSDTEIQNLPEKVRQGEYTLEDVLKDAKKAQELGLVKPGYGFYPRPKFGSYEQFAKSFGVYYVDENDKIVIMRSGLQRMFQFFHDAVYKEQVTKKTHIAITAQQKKQRTKQWYEEVGTGKAFVWNGGMWHYGLYLEQMKKINRKDFYKTFQFTLIPAGKGGKPNNVTEALYYYIAGKTSSQKAKLAMQLITMVTEPRYNTRHVLHSGFLGISSEQMKDPEYLQNRWIKEVSYFANYSFTPTHRYFKAFWKIVWNGLLDVWKEGHPPQEVTQRVLKQINANSKLKAIVVIQ